MRAGAAAQLTRQSAGIIPFSMLRPIFPAPLPSRLVFCSLSRGPLSRIIGRKFSQGHISVPAVRPHRVLGLCPFKPVSTSVQRYAAISDSPSGHINRDAEKGSAHEKLAVDPESVTTTSSVRAITEPAGADLEEDIDMLAGIKSDMAALRETFRLSEVPRDAFYLGLAGVLPYLATSISTFYLAWDIQYAYDHGQGFLLSGETAESLLHMIEPLQIGYGAVIISFLGAINWGLEFAGYGGHYTYRRYAAGVIAPMVAWPTILFPVEYALIAQFLTFNFLYYADARATRRGWFPSWYGTYRFVLTFIVGASIVLSLIGRGKVADKVARSSAPMDRLQMLRAVQAEQLALEEDARRAKMVAKDGSEDE